MNNDKLITKIEEIQANEFLKKINDLEFENSLLSQRNNLLEKQLESLTNKYNELKNELFDIEHHIILCKNNQTQLVNFNNKIKKNLNSFNFNVFKNKIKILFEYDDNFMENDSEVTIFNMIIDNIENIQNENLSLRKTLEDLNTIIYNIKKSNNNLEDDNIYNNFNNNNPSYNYTNNFKYEQNLFYRENDSFNKSKIFKNNKSEMAYDMTSETKTNNNNIIGANFYERDNKYQNLKNLMKNIDNLQKCL